MTNYEKVKEWRKKNPEKRAAQQTRESRAASRRNKHLKHTYGIDIHKYNEMFVEQEGKCLLCSVHQSELKKRLTIIQDIKWLIRTN